MMVAIFALTSAAGAVKLAATETAAPAAQERIPGMFLTGANEGAPLDIALNYIQENAADLELTAADVTDMVVTDMYQSQHNGVTHIYLQQQLNGIPVYNAVININIAADGSVINLGSRFVSDAANSVAGNEANVSASEAVEAVAAELGLSLTAAPQVIEVVGGATDKVILDGAGISQDAIPVELRYTPTDGGVYLSWDMVINEFSGLHWWSIRADAANGRVLSQYDWVVHENEGGDGDVPAYNVPSGGTGQSQNLLWNAAAAANNPDEYFVFAYPLEDPGDGAPSLEMDPADVTSNPFGWHDTDGAAGAEFTITRGNNVYADSDLDANNTPDGNAPDGGAGLSFVEFYSLNMDPSTYLSASIVNLFYWNNIMHDINYRYGFDELAGNFQENNYGNGGLGSDSVNADAQDGSGTDNANFATPSDGNNPRMQMYRTTYPFGQAVTVTAPLTLTDVYTANPSNNGGTANGLAGDIELVIDGTAPINDGCQAITNDLTNKIALILWSGPICNSSVFVQNAANAGAIAAIIIDNTPLPLSNFGGSPAIPSVAIGSTDGQAFMNALNNHTVTGSVGDHPVPGVDRDTDLDNGVIAHEFGHGVSNRLTGGPANVNCLGNQEQMGEGWSDLQTLHIHADPGDVSTDAREVGKWSLGAGFQGIRLFPYSTDMNVNPQTYDSIIDNGTSPHSLGEVWAVMVWEVYWNLVDKYGFNPDIYDDWTTGGNNLSFQLLLDGMKLQPCTPGMVDGRDAILAADMALTTGANQCEIWAGFAKRGLGYSADQGSPFSRTDGVEAFDMPPTCTSDVGVDGGDSPDPATAGSPLTYTFAVSNGGAFSATNVVLSSVLDVNTTYASVSTDVGSCSEASGVVTCNLGTFDPNDTASITLVVTPTVAGTVTNTVEVTVDQPEYLGNNSAVIVTTVQPGAGGGFAIYLPAVYKP
jgi:uncharacterized repeat protein (TIGR01451 family)